ncbi:MAG: beta-galactosidase [Phycisphaerae bacterium]|nr:beta-galactosidase [Phycisphaerae bacterium]
MRVPKQHFSFVCLMWMFAASLGFADLPAVKNVEAKDGRVLVNGKPFLPIGVYHAAHHHKAVPEVAAKGFNTVQVFGGTPEALKEDLDNAYANGMYGFAALHGLCEDLTRLEKIVLLNRDHPGLLVWYLHDEPNSRVGGPEYKDKPKHEHPYKRPPEKLKPAYDLIKKLDPKHPIWVNLAHGWVKDYVAYAPICDILSGDVYPVPKYGLEFVATYVNLAKKGGAGKKVLWSPLQMSPVRPDMKGDDRPPTMKEVHCATYMAIAHGTTGLMYYAFNEEGWEVEGWPWSNWRTSTSAPAYWAQWSDLTAELNSLAPLLLSPTMITRIGIRDFKSTDEKDAAKRSDLHLALKKGKESYLLIAVNGSDKTITASITLPEEVRKADTTAAVRFENRLQPLKNNIISDQFGPHEVHLYEIPFARPVSR